MKHSLVAVFSVLTCIVYGQLPGNWHQDVFGYPPYFAVSSNPAKTNLVHFRPPAQPTVDEQHQSRSFLVVARIRLLEEAFKNLENELRAQLSNAEAQIADLTMKLESTTQALEQATKDLADTKAVVVDLSSKLDETSDLSLATDARVDELETKQSDFETQTTDKIAELEAEIGAITCTCTADETTGDGLIPSSCEDLKQLGHTKGGFFSVKGIKQIETVYCDFTKTTTESDFQKLIGYQDVKSKPTYFNVQRTVKSLAKGVPIPYETIIVNTGDLDTTSGKFTAPVKGTYFFSFSGHVQIPITTAFDSYLAVLIYLNNAIVARSQLNELKTVDRTNYLDPLTVQATLQLDKGAQVWVQIDFRNAEYLYDDIVSRCTQFSGWLLEEEIVASLA